MILSIILLVIIIALILLLIAFLFYILFPSIKSKSNSNLEDPVISKKEMSFVDVKKEVIKKSDKKAIVLCSCHKEFPVQDVSFNQSQSCLVVNSVYSTGRDCKYACIGLGDCVRVCPQEAISIVNKTAVISSLCIGCGKCINKCPLKIITLIPKDSKTIVLCKNDNDSLTKCSSYKKEENVFWNDKKDFKMWIYCYRIINKFFFRKKIK
jgi:Na+-translocating ferredoxin:NAD+ oxidoreductase subunit B